MRPLPLTLYRLATLTAAPLAPLLLRTRARKGKEEPARLSERLGYASTPRPAGPLAWLHGASVGESLSLLPLIDGLQKARPDLSILVTSGTVTSAAMMAKRLPAGVIHQYAPIDTPAASGRFLQHWKPALTIFVESEIWPNLVLDANAVGSKLALISARLSGSSLRGWSRFPGAAKAVFGAFDLVMAQDDATAKGLVALGARDDGRLNLKRLGAPPPIDQTQLDYLRAALGKRTMLLAASTHPGEDEVVLEAFRQTRSNTVLTIAPRHPVRSGEIEKLARTAGLTVGLRSRDDPFGVADVYIADTLGELGLWFSLASTAFIGGSLLPGPGGHNPIEAAQLGCPIIAGPHLDNWREVYADLQHADAMVCVGDSNELAAAFSSVSDDRAAANARAERARHVVAQGRDALNRAVQGLISFTL